MENKVNLEQNRICHLEDSMVMYSIYNLDTLEQLFDTMHKIHNTTMWNEKVFASKLNLGIIGIYPRMELATMP